MELRKIEIENYKSITEPVTVHFYPNLPTVLIGKNGSGKTNVIEALEVIANANSNNGHGWTIHKSPLRYKVHIKFSKEDYASLLPGIQYDEKDPWLVAYSKNETYQVNVLNAIASPTLVPALKAKIGDAQNLAEEILPLIEDYEQELQNISMDGWMHNIYAFDGCSNELTNCYSGIKWAKENLENAKKHMEQLLGRFSESDEELLFGDGVRVMDYYWCSVPTIELQYVQPKLSPFMQQFVRIDETAIKNAIDEINAKTKTLRDKIKQKYELLRELLHYLDDKLWDEKERFDGQYSAFLREIKRVICNKCVFLKSDSNDVIFQKDEARPYQYYDRSYAIFETYLRHVCRGENKEKRLKKISNNDKMSLSDQELELFEKYLNKNIPEFDRGMYERITVEQSDENKISIYLEEKTGKCIHLNDTSAGRRWYYTYYFMKNTLQEGDVFIIDEPAAMLHPSAQKEILTDLMKLSERGIKVIYSTHSPYLIPREWKSVHFVTMDNGTKLTPFCISSEELAEFRARTPFDVFEYQEVADYYEKSNHKDMITRHVYACLAKDWRVKEIAEKLRTSEKAVYNWQSAKKHISFEHLLRASLLLNRDLMELIKEGEK